MFLKLLTLVQAPTRDAPLAMEMFVSCAMILMWMRPADADLPLLKLRIVSNIRKTGSVSSANTDTLSMRMEFVTTSLLKIVLKSMMRESAFYATKTFSSPVKVFAMRRMNAKSTTVTFATETKKEMRFVPDAKTIKSSNSMIKIKLSVSLKKRMSMKTVNLSMLKTNVLFAISITITLMENVKRAKFMT